MFKWNSGYKVTRSWLSKLDDERMNIVAGGIRRLVEGRRRGRDSGSEQTAQIVSEKRTDNGDGRKGRDG